MCARDDESLLETAAGSRIDTARLTLKPPRHADAAAIAAIVGDRRIAEMAMSIPYPYHPDDAHRWIDRNSEALPRGLGKFLLWRRSGEAGSESRELIGACGVQTVTGEEDVHLGYWVGVPFWGRGYATEAAHAVIDHVFTAGGLDEIKAACRVTNPASRRVIEKCGFQFRSNGIIHSLGAGGIVSVEKFVLERAIWESLKAW